MTIHCGFNQSSSSFESPAVLFIMGCIHSQVRTFWSVDKTVNCHFSNECYNNNYYLLQCTSVLYYNVVVTFESVNEILKHGHSDESLTAF